jgi:hypothetical protein
LTTPRGRIHDFPNRARARAHFGIGGPISARSAGPEDVRKGGRTTILRSQGSKRYDTLNHKGLLAAADRFRSEGRFTFHLFQRQPPGGDRENSLERRMPHGEWNCEVVQQ